MEKSLANQPNIVVEYADLAINGDWLQHFKGADAVVMLQAQIGGNDQQDYIRNNVDSTRLVLKAIKDNNISQLVHISSSVVESAADDFYTQTKKEQETMVISSGIDCPILRPTLMFGWFDRKHFGWLSRLMKKIPIFPIPGNGRYMRQPLYVGDFCNINPGVNLAGRVTVGDSTFIGIGASVKDNVTIGKNVIIGAGSVVLNNVLDNTMVYGVPAKAR